MVVGTPALEEPAAGYQLLIKQKGIEAVWFRYPVLKQQDLITACIFVI